MNGVLSDRARAPYVPCQSHVFHVSHTTKSNGSCLIWFRPYHQACNNRAQRVIIVVWSRAALGSTRDWRGEGSQLLTPLLERSLTRSKARSTAFVVVKVEYSTGGINLTMTDAGNISEQKQFSCYQCRARKLKCNRVWPCQRCVQLGEKCQFAEARRRPGQVTAKTPRVKELEGRLGKMFISKPRE